MAYTVDCDKVVREAELIRARPTAQETLDGIELLTFGAGIDPQDVTLIEEDRGYTRSIFVQGYKQ